MEKDFHEYIKTIISNSDTTEALDALLEKSRNNKGIHDTISMIAFDYNELKKQKIKGIIDSKDANVRLNDINSRLLESLSFFTKKGEILKFTYPSLKKKGISISGAGVLAILTVTFAVLTYIGTNKSEEWIIISGFFCIASSLSLLIALILSSLKSKSK